MCAPHVRSARLHARRAVRTRCSGARSAFQAKGLPAQPTRRACHAPPRAAPCAKTSGASPSGRVGGWGRDAMHPRLPAGHPGQRWLHSSANGCKSPANQPPFSQPASQPASLSNVQLSSHATPPACRTCTKCADPSAYLSRRNTCEPCTKASLGCWRPEESALAEHAFKFWGCICSSPTSSAYQPALVTCTRTSPPLTPTLSLLQPNCVACDRDGKCAQCAAGFTAVGGVCKPCTVNCTACAPGKPGICTACGEGAYVGNGGRSCLAVSGGCMRNERVVACCAPACCLHVWCCAQPGAGAQSWHALFSCPHPQLA